MTATRPPGGGRGEGKAMAIDEQGRERVIGLVEEGGHDTELWRRISLNRQQMGYICALLEYRMASKALSRGETGAEVAERVTGCMRRVVQREVELSGLYHGGTGASGIDHLLDFLGEVMAESDGHGLWEVTE